MLMGRLPGSPLPATPNTYAGAQSFTSMPLQSYVLPQPVPRPPVMAQPPTLPVAPLPAAIEAWRAQLLTMHPFYLSQRFGMPVAQIRQILADPQSATMLYYQTDGHSAGLGFGRAVGRETSGMGSAADRAIRGADLMRAGYVDSFSDFVDAVRSGISMVADPIRTSAASIAEMATGAAPGSRGGLAGSAQQYDTDLQAAVRNGQINPKTGRAWTRAEAISEQARRDAGRKRSEQNERDRVASRGAGPGGRGPTGGGAYGGMGGVGSHGV